METGKHIVICFHRTVARRFSFMRMKHIRKITTQSPPAGALIAGGV